MAVSSIAGTSSSGARRRNRRSLKVALLSVICCLAAMALLVVGYQALVSWRTYSDASRLTLATAAGNRLVAGVFELLLERLATNNALQASEAISAAARKEIDTRRAAAEAGYAGGLPATLEQSFPNKAVLIQDLSAAVEKARQYRERADHMLALPKGQRDEDLLKT